MLRFNFEVASWKDEDFKIINKGTAVSRTGETVKETIEKMTMKEHNLNYGEFGVRVWGTEDENK